MVARRRALSARARRRRVLVRVVASAAVAFAFVATDLAIPASASAADTATFTWTGGGGDDKWSNAKNWDAGVPTAASTVVIPVSDGSLEINVDVSPASTDDILLGVSGSGSLHLAGNPTGFSRMALASGDPTVEIDNDLSPSDAAPGLQIVWSSGGSLTLAGAVLKKTVTATVREKGAAKLSITGGQNNAAAFTISGVAVTLDKNAGKSVADSMSLSEGTLTFSSAEQFNPAYGDSDLALSNSSAELDSPQTLNSLTLADSTVEAYKGELTVQQALTSTGASAVSGEGYGLALGGDAVALASGADDQAAEGLTISAPLRTSAKIAASTGGAEDAIEIDNGCADTADGSIDFAGPGTLTVPDGFGGTVHRSGGTVDRGLCDGQTSNPPGQPKSLTAASGDTVVDLSWTAPDSLGDGAFLGYQVQRNTCGAAGCAQACPALPCAGKWEDLTASGPITGTSFHDSGLENGTTYWYRVVAVNDNGPGVAAVLTDGVVPQVHIDPPSAPATFQALAGSQKVKLVWTPPVTEGSGTLSGYRIYRSTDPAYEPNPDSNPIADVHRDNPDDPASPIPTSYYDDNDGQGLENGTEYYYFVQAYTTAASGPVASANATPDADTGLKITMSPEYPPAPGIDVPLDLTFLNNIDEDLPGPVTATVLLPNDDAQQLGYVDGGGDGWQCTSGSIVDKTIVTCVNQQTIQSIADFDTPGDHYPQLTLTVHVPAEAALGTDLISYSVATPTLTSVTNAPQPFVIAAAQHAHLALSATVPPLANDQATGSEEDDHAANQELTVSVTNDGTANTTGPLQIRFPLPDGVTITQQATTDFWQCSVNNDDARVAQCEADTPLMPTAAAPPVKFGLAVDPLPAGSAPVGLTVTASSQDPFGEISADARTSVVAPTAAQPVVEPDVQELTPDELADALESAAPEGVEASDDGSASPAEGAGRFAAMAAPASHGRIQHIGLATAPGSAGTAGRSASRALSVGAKTLTNQSAAIKLNLTNAGQATANSAITLVQTLPVSQSTAVDISLIQPPGGGWTATVSNNIVKVTAPPSAIAAGASLVGPILVTTPVGPPTRPVVSVFSPALFTSSIVASLAGMLVGGGSSSSQPAQVSMSSPPPPAEPTPTTKVTLQQSPIMPGLTSHVTFSYVAHPSLGPADKPTFALLAPSQVTLTDVGLTAVPTGFPDGAPAPTCQLHGNATYAGGATQAIVCVMDAPAPAGSRIDVTAAYTAASNVAGDVLFSTGTLDTDATASVTDRFTQAWGLLTATGSSALGNANEIHTNGAVLTASAGAPQRVDSSTPSDTGPQPTRVVLDASDTTSVGVPLSYRWIQTTGPPVTWQPPAPNTPDVSPGSSGNPSFPAATDFGAPASLPLPAAPLGYGKQSAFTVPQVLEHTELNFTLFVTDGNSVSTAVTTVAVDPVKDNPPTISGATLTDGSNNPLNTDATPAAGTTLRLDFAYSDVEGDPVVLTPAVLRPTELASVAFTPVSNTATAGVGHAIYSFTWPVGATTLTVGATATDGHNDDDGNPMTGTYSLTVGPDDPPVGVVIAPVTDAVTPGATVHLTSTLTNGTIGTATTDLVWSVLGGAGGTITEGTPDTSATYAVPGTAHVGDTITVQATATRGTGSSASIATATVPLTVAAPDALGATFKVGDDDVVDNFLTADASTADTPKTKQITATGTGGTAPYTWSWSVISGAPATAIPTADKTKNNPTITMPQVDGLVTLGVTVTDAAGASVSQLISVLVGPTSQPNTDVSACTPASGDSVGGVFTTILNKLPTKGDADHVSFDIGDFHLDLGTKQSLLANNTQLTGSCDANTVIQLNGAAATYNGIGLTNLAGSFSKDAITITSAVVTLPSEWGLTNVAVQNFSVRFKDTSLTPAGLHVQGTLVTSASLPMLSTPTSVGAINTQLTVDSVGFIGVSATASLAGGTIAIGGAYCFRKDADCANVPAAYDTDPANTTHTFAKGVFKIHATATNISLLGGTFNGSGNLSYNPNAVAPTPKFDGALHLAWNHDHSDLGSNAFNLTDISFDWTREQLKLKVDATAASNKIDLHLDGTYVDSSHWSANVSGGVHSAWDVAPSLTLAAATYAGDDHHLTGGTGVQGSIAKNNDKLSYSFLLSVASPNWSTGPLTIKGIQVKIASGGDAPAACALTADQNDKMYVDVVGISEINWGSGDSAKKVDINAEACIVPGVGFSVVTTANLTNVELVHGFELTGVTLGVKYVQQPSTLSISLNATATVMNVHGAVTVALQTGDGGTDFLADVAINLGDLHLPMDGWGHLMYSTKPISDLGTIPGLGDQIGFGTTSSSSTPGSGGASPAATRTAAAAEPGDACLSVDTDTPTLEGIGLPAGFTALTQFSLPASACQFLANKIGLPPKTNLAVSISMGSGPPTIKATLSVGGDGLPIFTTNTDKPVNQQTELDLKNVSLTLSLGGSFGLEAAATLRMPNPRDSTADRDDLELKAAVTIQFSGTPAITITLSKEGDVWHNAFGVDHLDLGNLAIQGGIVFGAPFPLPSIGFGAQIVDLPADLKTDLGICGVNPDCSGQMEPAQFVVNISTKNPIFDLELGTADGHDFMRPLAIINHDLNSSLAQKFTIDEAQLIIAPMGGDVGPFHFEPGISMKFDSKILGTNVHVDARINPDPTAFEISAHMNIGAFSVGPVSVQETILDFDLSVANKGLSLYFSGGFSAGSIHTNAVIDMAFKYNNGLDAHLKFNASVGGVTIASGFSLDTLAIAAQLDLSSSNIKNNIPSLNVGAIASAHVLGVQLTLGGAIALGPAGIQGLDLVIASSPIQVGGTPSNPILSISGSGCDASKLNAMPTAILTLIQSEGLLPSSGPCFQVGFHPGTANPFYLKVSGSMTLGSSGSNGLTAAIDAQVDNTSLAINTATVQLGSVFNVSIHDSVVYWADPAAGVTLHDPIHPSTAYQAHAGDFRLQATTSVNLASFFQSNLTVDIGHVQADGNAWWAKANASLGLFQSESSPIHANISLAGDFAKSGSTVTWSLSGSGALTVGGAKSGSTWTGGYSIISASFCIGNNCAGHAGVNYFSVAGSLHLGTVLTATVNVSLAFSTTVSFYVSASGSVNIMGSGVSASVILTNQTPNHAVQLTASFNVNLGSFIKLNGSATIMSTGAFCVAGSVDIGAGQFAHASATVCTPGVPGQTAGVSADFNALGLIWVHVSANSQTGITASATLAIPVVSIGGISCHWYGCYGLEAGFGGYMIIGVTTQSSYDVTVPYNYPGVSNHVHFAGPGVFFKGFGYAYLKGCFVGCLEGSISVSMTFDSSGATFCGSIGGIGGLCYKPPAHIWTT